MNKILYGLTGNKITVMDVDTSVRAKKQCLKEGCTSVVVADYSLKLSNCFLNEHDVDMSMFEGVVL